MGRITADDDIVARIIGTLHTGEVGCHTCWVAPATGKSIGFVDGEQSRRNEGRVVIGFVALAFAFDGDDETDRLLARWDIGTDRVRRSTDDAVFLATPEDIVQLRRSDQTSARTWRLNMREELSRAFQTHEVTGFTKEGSYVLTPRHTTKGQS